MESLEAKEIYSIPASFPWCIAISESQPSGDEFPTLRLSRTDGKDMTVIYGISFVGVALTALGVALMVLGTSEGNFVAGVGCLLFAVAGIWMRLTDRRHSRLRS